MLNPSNRRIRTRTLSQNELAAMTELAPVTVARLVDRLEELGLVERCADPKDRRMWRLQLTSVASSLVRDVKALRAQLFLVATKGINAGVLGAMARCLQQMKENVRLLAECGEADIQTAERDCWRTLSNIEPQSKKIVSG